MTESILSTIIGELSEAAAHVDESQLLELANACESASRIFVGGAGRSGFVGRGLANRLLHLGLAVSFIGEPTTPPIDSGDLLIVISGSGRTASLLASAKKARGLGASVATVTLDPTAPIGTMSDPTVVLPGTSRLAEAGDGGVTSMQPVGSLFEQLSWLVCDALVVILRDRSGQSNDDLLARHANME